MARRGVSIDGMAVAMITDIRRLTDGMVDQVEEIFIDTAYEAADEMQQIIKSDASSTPTGLARGDIGRVKTGAMHDSAGQVDVARGRSQIAARFGYRGADEDYFVYQDRGFQHVGANKWIEGTNALLTAMGSARERFQARMLAIGLRRKGF
jgi:hypothetical protein